MGSGVLQTLECSNQEGPLSSPLLGWNIEWSCRVWMLDCVWWLLKIFQLRITNKDQLKTTFITPWGCFSYKVMSFGLTNASATFQHFVTYVFFPFLGRSIRVFIDDFCIYSSCILHLAKSGRGFWEATFTRWLAWCGEMPCCKEQSNTFGSCGIQKRNWGWSSEDPIFGIITISYNHQATCFLHPKGAILEQV